MRVRTALSTRTTDGMTGKDGQSVSSTAHVSVMETSVVITAAAADTDGLGPTVTREFLLVSACPPGSLGRYFNNDVMDY